MKNPLSYWSARPESGREVRKRYLVAPLGRTQSERHRRLALASGFRLLSSEVRCGRVVGRARKEKLACPLFDPLGA
jgi:hypothetical protein